MKTAVILIFYVVKNRFQMYDESPVFSGKILKVLTINARSENQAVEVYVARERFGSWEPGLLTRGGNVRLSGTTEFWRLFPINWEAASCYGGVVH
ncbi:hypothetical protein [Nostoc sp.]|uniref:hypothetical protein n=1 Tax=Nostoc sp. TaxID=1180 RepID=UPI002FF9FB1C